MIEAAVPNTDNEAKGGPSMSEWLEIAIDWPTVRRSLKFAVPVGAALQMRRGANRQTPR